ncbi:OmpA family protein [Acidiphilium acidophilum]|uniref:OmpA family protein n=1 Tax=Acidiphilium acidophilum TaxID=76588 RepID=A0AAW9DSA6_ACIAO|nr:OmpA family protein [Acidiphilium acidophilum]MDX5931900.1 OmpA family protein [Acidiphilium acidophilum]MEE3502705.1 OmpA family protein [Acidiphilium acidophilum]
MKIRSTLLVASFIAAPALLPIAAKAQPVTGPYVSAGLGYNVMNSRKVESYAINGVSTNLGGKALFSNGFTGEASIGYGFGNGFRVELEGDYFNNQVKKLDVGPNQFVASGNEKKFGAMVNGLYDFDIGIPYLYPFIGAGVGYQFLDWRNVEIPGTGSYINGTPGSFAYQGIVGMSFPIPGAPGLAAQVQYRYMSTIGTQHYKAIEDGHPATFKVGRDSNNMVLVGLSYELFPPMPPAAPAPAPTPVAAPAPAPARTYLVFFNWNKADLTPRATQIVAEAAQASQTTHVTSLNVNGYTDTSGSPGYNMKLSYRRADNVAAQLVTDGVPKSDIVIKGFGETHLLVPTGPGVREPQNRRVEIILH